MSTQRSILVNNAKGGRENENKVKVWLEKRGFKIEDSHEDKPSNKPYDIIATKNGKKWIIEVKGGKKPSVRLENIITMLNEKKVDMVGLALVIDGHPYLFSYRRYTFLAEKAHETIERKKMKSNEA